MRGSLDSGGPLPGEGGRKVRDVVVELKVRGMSHQALLEEAERGQLRAVGTNRMPERGASVLFPVHWFRGDLGTWWLTFSGPHDGSPFFQHLLCALGRPRRACCSRGNPEYLFVKTPRPAGTSVLEKMSPGDGI